MSYSAEILLVMQGDTVSNEVYVEGWGTGYGSPYRVETENEEEPAATLVEDEVLQAHDGRDDDAFSRIAFIDGVRRVEASLYQLVDDRFVRGITGALACGCVVIDHSGAHFTSIHVERLMIWGAGMTDALPPIKGGWAWTVASVAGDDAEAPLAGLQARMRVVEGGLAEETAVDGTIVVADGPLNFALSSHRAVVGYVKTHRRALLGPIDHARVTGLRSGQRSSLFRIGDERYSCYLRLRDQRDDGPWNGIVRLEFGAALGAAASVAFADRLTARLPKYAGVPHRDARAPQNLQPIGALELHLRRQLGSDKLAERAVREAVRMRRNASAA